MKYIIFDAGPIISLTMNGLLPVLEKLSGEFNGEFIITPDVKREIIDRPLKVKKYELEGVKVQNLIDKGVLKLSNKFVPNNKLDKEKRRILNLANSALRIPDKKINLIHKGEASCLAFSNLCGCENVIVIDERSTRLLIEAPENLKKLMEMKLHTKIDVDMNKLKSFRRQKFIRSAELLFVAYKKDLIGLKKSKLLLDALLYGVKFKGTAISSKEIEEMKRMV